ncbi:sensor histidine kinase [Tsuneonella sp. HG222]
MKSPEAAWPIGTPPAASHCGEAERARVIASYGVDALVDDPELSAITRFAAHLCETPIALVSLVEETRQLFLARDGLDATETPRDTSFCAHAMLLGSAMVVTDAREDARFAQNPLVTGPPHIRFYAGQPLIAHDGTPLGSLCVIDSEPRPHGLTDLQRHGLEVLAASVMRRLRGQREELASAREHDANEARFRALADSIPDIAWSAGTDGRPNYFNRRWFEYVGVEQDDLSKSGVDFFHPDDYPTMRAAWEKSVADGTPFEHENRLLRHDGDYRWMISRAVPMRDADGQITQWFGTLTDIDETRRLSESRDLLAKELSHRIKNIFAVVAGLVSLSARSRPEHKPFADELTDTIRALGRAHDFVRSNEGGARDSLQGLLTELFAPYGTGEAARVRISGHDCNVSNRAATPLALVFHELATNSAKYGALANPGGHVDLTLEDGGEQLHLHWVEHGGKVPLTDPEPGFGSRLVEMSITGQLGGSWERHFEPGGLVADLRFAISSVCDCD